MNWISKFVIVVLMLIWLILSLPLVAFVYMVSGNRILDDMLDVIDKATNS